MYVCTYVRICTMYVLCTYVCMSVWSMNSHNHFLASPHSHHIRRGQWRQSRKWRPCKLSLSAHEEAYIPMSPSASIIRSILNIIFQELKISAAARDVVNTASAHLDRAAANAEKALRSDSTNYIYCLSSQHQIIVVTFGYIINASHRSLFAELGTLQAASQLLTSVGKIEVTDDAKPRHK